jgi:hypothetical protein
MASSRAMLATFGAGLNCEPLVSYGVWSYKRLYMSCDIKEVLAISKKSELRMCVSRLAPDVGTPIMAEQEMQGDQHHRTHLWSLQ